MRHSPICSSRVAGVGRWQAPLKYAEWDAKMMVERASADDVAVLATAPVGTTPRAVFHATVLGPSSMQVRALHMSGLTVSR